MSASTRREIKTSAAKLTLECTARQRRREWRCGLLGRLGGRLRISRLIGRRRGGALADDLLRLWCGGRRCRSVFVRGCCGIGVGCRRLLGLGFRGALGLCILGGWGGGRGSLGILLIGILLRAL